jgi:DNA invertase Pin-like site-specific DNA recombinase
MQIAGYTRASTDRQKITPEAQEHAIKLHVYYQMANGEWAGREYLGCFHDTDVSSRIDMIDRPGGQALIETLGRGDVIIVSRFDRAFRSAADAERWLQLCDEMGIEMVFLDMKVDTSTSVGKMRLGSMAVVARVERDIISERITEALAEIRRQGRPVGTATFLGFVPVKSKETGKTMHCRPDANSRLKAERAYAMLRDGFSQEELFKQFFYGKGSPSAKRLVRLACAYALGFPRLSQANVEAAIGRRYNAALVQLSPTRHTELRAMIVQYCKQHGITDPYLSTADLLRQQLKG